MPATLDPALGLVAQPAAEIFAEVGAAIQASTGRSDLDVSTSSPAGRLLWPFAERVADLQGLLAAGLWSLDPETAGGPLLGVVALLRGTARVPASSTTITLRAAGTPGVDVSGRAVRSPAGDVFYLGPSAVIGVTGFVLSTATAAETGPIPAPSMGSWSILDPVAGWVSVMGEPETTQLGEDEERDLALRQRLRESLSQAKGTEPAIYSALAALPGVDVSYLSVWSNRTSIPDAAGLPAHSVEAIVLGGEDAQVGEALYRAASGSAGFYQGPGSTLVSFVLSEDGRTRQVWITRPTSRRVYAEVTLHTGGATVPLPAGVEATVRAAIADWSQIFRPRVTLTAASAEAYLVPYLPAGSVSDVEVLLSLDGVSYSTWAPPGFRAYGRISDVPSPAEIQGTLAEPFAIAPGWALDLSINGGPAQNFVLTGSETTAADVATVLASLSGATASDAGGVLRVETSLTGSLASIEILGTSSAGLLAVLGLSAGTASGRDTDIAVVVV